MFGRLIALGGLVALLGGCSAFGQEEEPVAAAPPPAAAPAPEEPAPALPQARPAGLEDRYASLREEPPEVDAGTLIGMDFGALRGLLGEPNEQQARAPAEIWTYRGENCDLQVFFYPQVGGDDYRALLYEVDQKAKASSEMTARERENACLSTLMRERATRRSVV